jgi:uncharacterized protein YuzE
MAIYTYDEEADALYILLVPESEASIAQTVALGDQLHVDVDGSGRPVGVEVLYPSQGGIDLEPVARRFGLNLRLPFSFAA